MDDDSIGWHDPLCLFSETFQPAFVLFELFRFCGRAGIYLDATTLELVCGNDLDGFGWAICELRFVLVA